jgi:hypothetical protein
MDDKRIPNMVAVDYRRELHWGARQSLDILLSDLTPFCGPLVEAREFMGKNERLYSFHPVVEAELSVEISLLLSMMAEPRDAVGEAFIISRN